MTKAFLSHSSHDNVFAQKITQLLAELGVSVWIYSSDIRAGTNWVNTIQRALDECELMLLVLTPEAMESEYVQKEWLYFLQKEKPLIPLLLRPTNIHFMFMGLQYVDFFNLTFSAAFAELCLSLKSKGFRVGNSSKQRPVITSATPGLGKSSPPADRLINPGEPSAQGVPVNGLAPGQLRIDQILPPPFAWVEVDDGEQLLMDGRLNRDGGLPLPIYYIARYPITNAQYQVFADATDGYREDGWWNFSDSARRWRATHSRPRQPEFRGDDLPRTEVSWFEAVAFCRWLSFHLAGERLTLNVTLPTVQQWHWAAVADTGWPYPWGDRFSPRRCNTAESRIGRTTPVTQYPWGESACGVMDMCGNCWEWCLNDWVTGTPDLHHEADHRFVLGGSWRDSRGYACVQHQPCRKPGVRRNTQGFRIAATLAS